MNNKLHSLRLYPPLLVSPSSRTCAVAAYRVVKQSIFALFLCLSWTAAGQSGALDMPAMPDMPSMPAMPSPDEPMAGRKAFEARSSLMPSVELGAKHQSDAKAKSGKSQSSPPQLVTVNGDIKNPSLSTGTGGIAAPAPSVPAPSPTSPISSFGTPLSDYSDIDALLQRLAAQKSTADAVPSSPPSAAQQALNTSILRFVINGSDIRGSLRNVHFSTPEADGSFLLTAERRFWAQGTPRIEPFYMLFTSQGPNSRSYTVTCSVVQEAEESVLCRLSRTEPLVAVKTGNLITMRASGEGLLCDLLLDIGK